MRRAGIILLVLILCQLSQLFSQETQPKGITLTLEEAEARFLARNYQLLASKYMIDASKAATIQAQLWSNPNLALEQNIFNPQTGNWFDATARGNTEFQIQQLILLAGKRSKQISLTEINTKSSELQFIDLTRNLKYQLRKTFFDIFFLQRQVKFFDKSIAMMTQTVMTSETLIDKHLIRMSEVLRLKALLNTLFNTRQDIVNKIEDIQSDLRTIMGDTIVPANYYIPEKDLSFMDTFSIEKISMYDLLKKGLESRPDYKIALNAISYEQNNLEYQKALATPDLSIGGRWSRAGSYINNYWAISLSMDLPFFNKNEGNIKMSEAVLENNRAALAQSKASIENDIISAYNKMLNYEKLYKSIDRNFPDQFTDYVASMLDNYQKRNITIIEFTDFFESYRDAMLQINQLQNNIIDALEYLNFTIGTDFVKF